MKHVVDGRPWSIYHCRLCTLKREAVTAFDCQTATYWTTDGRIHTCKSVGAFPSRRFLIANYILPAESDMEAEREHARAVSSLIRRGW